MSRGTALEKKPQTNKDGIPTTAKFVYITLKNIGIMKSQQLAV